MGTYQVSGGSVAPGGEENYQYQQIMKMLHGINTQDIGCAALSLLDLADTLDTACDNLQNQANQLAANGSWKGDAATAAVNKFAQVHDQTAEFAAQVRTAGNTLTWLNNQVLTPYQEIQSPQVASGAEQSISTAMQASTNPVSAFDALTGHGVNGTAKANAAAQNYLKTLNTHLQTADNRMPKTMTAPGNISGGNWVNKTGGSSGSGSGGGSVAGGYGGVSGSNSPSGGSGTAVPSFTPVSSPFPSSKLTHGGAVPNASLQGYSAPSGTTANPYAPAPAPAVPRNPNPFTPLSPVSPNGPDGPGRLRNGPDDPEPNRPVDPEPEPDPGPGPDGPNGPADETPGDPAAAERAGAAEGEGSSGMPMGAGGGGGSQDQERQREAWMHQDTEIWGASETFIGNEIS